MKAIKIISIIFLTLIVLIGIAVYAVIQIYFKVPSLKVSDSLERGQQVEIIDSWLSDLQSKNKFNGVVLMIVKDEVVLEKGYGFTDFTLENALTPQSSMRLASVSKQFTAAGIMALHDQGALNFEDDVSKHIKGFPYQGVAIRHLLNQTSGVPENYMALGEANITEGNFLSLEKAVALVIAENEPAYAPPNTKYGYSNTDYLILARIAELVSGQSFEDFMQETIFSPMGMKNTRVWNALSPDKTYPNKTEGFDIDIGNETEKVDLTVLDGVAGDGGIFGSIEDFKIWNQFWNANPIISPATLEQAFIAPKLANGKSSNYGFGWVLTPNAHWHNGQWLAANSIIIRNPSQKSALVVIDNSYRLSFDSVTKELSKAMRTLNQ